MTWTKRRHAFPTILGALTSPIWQQPVTIVQKDGTVQNMTVASKKNNSL